MTGKREAKSVPERHATVIPASSAGVALLWSENSGGLGGSSWKVSVGGRYRAV